MKNIGAAAESMAIPHATWQRASANARVSPHNAASLTATLSVPAGVVLGDEDDRRTNQAQGAIPLRQKLLTDQVRRTHTPAVRVDGVVPVNRLGQINPETIDVEFLDELGRAADEQSPHALLA